MKKKKAFMMALSILRHSKLRSWLTIIGIVIGVAAVIAIMSLGAGMQQALQSRLGGLGADIITVSPGASRAAGIFGNFGGGGNVDRAVSTSTAKNLTSKDVQVIRTVDNVQYAEGLVSGRAQAYYLGEEGSVSVQGVDPLIWSITTTSTLESGRFLSPSEHGSIVVGSRIASSMFKQPLALNRMLTIEGKSFKIVGILQQSGSMGGSDSAVIMNIEDARTILSDAGADKFDSIQVKVSDANLVESTTSAIDTRLMLSRHVNNNTKDYSVSSSVSMQETISSTMESMTLFLAAIAAVSLLVGAIGIANTMFTTVLEKTKEIGIMKAIGAKNSDVMLIFMMNSALVGVVGGVIGILLGPVAASFMNFGTATGAAGRAASMGGSVVTPELVGLGLLISVGIGMASGIIPAYRASKLRPVEALRYE